MSEKLKPAVSAEIRRLIDLKFITPTDSPQVSPLVCIMKGKTIEDGIRLAVDYKHVNASTVDSHHPIDNIPDLIHKIGRSTYISCFDARSGYWQTGVEKSQQWLTAFICDDVTFSWTHTPFGFKFAGYT